MIGAATPRYRDVTVAVILQLRHPVIESAISFSSCERRGAVASPAGAASQYGEVRQRAPEHIGHATTFARAVRAMVAVLFILLSAPIYLISRRFG